METDVQESWLVLRECWAELKCGESHSLGDAPLPLDLQQRHTQALEALVAGGELSAGVAEQVKAAFWQTFDHIQSTMSMCYIAMRFGKTPREDFVEQVAALEEMADNSDLDPAVVARVREVLERDIAWLAQSLGGKDPGDVSDVEVDTSSAEAARVLVELLLKDGGIA
jgi:hypothetical protein